MNIFSKLSGYRKAIYAFLTHFAVVWGALAEFVPALSPATAGIFAGGTAIITGLITLLSPANAAPTVKSADPVTQIINATVPAVVAAAVPAVQAVTQAVAQPVVQAVNQVAQPIEQTVVDVTKTATAALNAFIASMEGAVPK